MCEVCEFYEKLEKSKKTNPALAPEGQRTIHGYYHENDTAILAKYYPRVGQKTIAKIASLINQPRLLEVTGLVELIERYLEGSFSKIRNQALNIVSNPLSILYWAPNGDETVHRVKTRESELLHSAMEKMALRRGSLEKINQFLDQQYGVVVTYGCSCCGIVVAAKDLEALYDSAYYTLREGFGRAYDSDVLTTNDSLFEGVSVADVPDKILEASADFGHEEVASYLRFAKAAQTAISENPVIPDLSKAMVEVRSFLTGKYSLTETISR